MLWLRVCPHSLSRHTQKQATLWKTRSGAINSSWQFHSSANAHFLLAQKKHMVLHNHDVRCSTILQIGQLIERNGLPYTPNAKTQGNTHLHGVNGALKSLALTTVM